jgi:hypothetical protein
MHIFIYISYSISEFSFFSVHYLLTSSDFKIQPTVNVNVNLYYGAVDSRFVNDETEAPGTPWSAEGSLKQMSMDRDCGGDRGNDPPKVRGRGIKCLISPNIFTVQKMIFNASSVPGCFYKKFQPELKLG